MFNSIHSIDVGPNVVVIVLAILQLITLVYTMKTRNEVKSNGGTTVKDKTDATHTGVVAIVEHLGLPPITPPCGTPTTRKEDH